MAGSDTGYCLTHLNGGSVLRSARINIAAVKLLFMKAGNLDRGEVWLNSENHYSDDYSDLKCMGSY